MAQVTKEPHRLQVSDGALIPTGRSGLVSWQLAFWGALTIIGFLLVWKPDPYWRILQFLPDGILVTFQVTVLGIVFATFIGLLAGLGQIVPSRPINHITMVYIEVIRGIPLLVQLFYIYYALGGFLNIEGMVAAVIAMTICYGAYLGEIFRAGIQSIPKGQMEAAISLGLSRRQAMRKVILPQTVRIILPAIGNEFIALLKDSSLVSVVAISDLLRRGREFVTTSFMFFETYTMVALVYLILTLFLSRMVGLLESHMGKYQG